MRHVAALIIQADEAVDELAANKLIFGVHPAARKPVNQVLVVVGVAGVRHTADKPYVLETVVGEAAAQRHHDGGVFRSGCQGHVLESHVIGTIKGEGAVVGVASITGHYDLLVVGTHATENDAVGRISAVDAVEGDKLLVGARSHLENDLPRHTSRQRSSSRAE